MVLYCVHINNDLLFILKEPCKTPSSKFSAQQFKSNKEVRLNLIQLTVRGIRAPGAGNFDIVLSLHFNLLSASGLLRLDIGQ